MADTDILFFRQTKLDFMHATYCIDKNSKWLTIDASGMSKCNVVKPYRGAI